MVNVVSAFQEIVKKMPHDTAVVYEGKSWTYQELDEQSNRIAAFLKSQGVKGKQVGTAMKRGPEWMVALLGLWKAGAVYVPLDLSHPRERLEFILADCEVSLVICSRKGNFKPRGTVSYYVDEMCTTEPLADSFPLPAEKDRACLIYTSGTSGEPKGIPYSQRQVVRMSHLSKDRYFYVEAGDKMLQLASLNFSASLGETLTGLLNGVCLVVASDKERQSPALLIELIERENVGSAFIPPALLSVFPKVPLPGLRTLVVGGEGVAVDVKDFWMEGRRMVNAYGFTENTALVTSGIYEKDTEVNDIGTLVPDCVAYILDEELRPVPDGIPGELYVGGTQLTEGYWRRPQLNRQKFIDTLSLRLYKSGDKVMRMPNGHYLYLGRLDNQVNIRGMRIELTEIEQCLNQYPGISTSVVVVKKHIGRQLLVAYLQTENEIDKDKVAAFVAGKLPDNMRPAYYMQLREFPLTVNRKIDKKRLPEPDWVASGERQEPPVTPVEKEIKQVWCKLLGVSGIGRYDNFVALGGDSISVFLMTNALEEAFGIPFKVEDVFSRLELYVLAQFVEQRMQEEQGDSGDVLSEFTDEDSLLSPALRNLWSQCVSCPALNEAYKLAVILPWSKDAEVEAIRAAWNRMVRQQETLRMSFPLRSDGEPLMRVSPFIYTEIPVYEVEEGGFWENAYRRYALPFDPETGPLYRVSLYRLSGGEYRLVVIIHHLLTDGWSLRLLNEMLHNYYEQAMCGEYSPEKVYSYRSYVFWSRRQLDSIAVKERKLFWKGYLSDCPELYFEGEGNGKEQGEWQGSVAYMPISAELGKQLEDFCGRHAVTPLTVCLSVFQIVLAKYAGQRDFAVGFAVTDRKRQEFQRILGYFASLLPVRVLRGEKKSFQEYTAELMETVVNLLRHSLPLDMILEETHENPRRRASHRFIRLVFGLEESPSNFHIPEEWVTTTAFDMSFIIHKYKGIYSLHFQYATACFDSCFIRRFGESFQVALRWLLQESSGNVWGCPLLSETEIAKRTAPFVFSEWAVPEWNVAERFAKIAAEQPEREAYCWSGLRTSYGELHETSHRVAAAIGEKFRVMGKKPDRLPIGIYLEEKKYLLPAVLGILESGACYVPLDKSLPLERIKFILQDAAVSLLLVDGPVAGEIGCETLLVADLVSFHFPEVYRPVQTAPEDIAYIIYTSGTTGKPKGIPVSHGSLAFFADNQVKINRLLPDKRVLQYAGTGFDASVLEIFPTLLSGATLVMPTETERKDATRLLDLIEKEKVYCTLLPPALLAVLPYRVLPDLKVLLVGGESTPPQVMERWKKGRCLINAYGPTENTVLATCREVPDNFLFNDIGFPLPGVSCYVLDETMTLLPDDVSGELYIGGLQLTAGYVNRPELNRDKFVENPYVSPQDKKRGINTRLYKSGDRVMRTPKGNFLFLGRKDSQVKLRGFRIELEEIAHHLEEYPDIMHAMVLLKEQEGEKRLVAYLLVAEKEGVDMKKLRQFLYTRLPFYMIPSAWCVLEKFPLTVNGKIDREALPESRLMVSEDYQSPLSREETILSEVVARLLQLPRIGVYTDLFDIGLTSLQVMELIKYAHEENVTVSVSDIYKGRCIRNILANRISSMFHWVYGSKPRQPLIILVCGYSYSQAFYGRFLERFRKDYSFFVFESFLEYFKDKKVFTTEKLVNYYMEVLQEEVGDKEIYAVAGHCLGGELGLLLAERLRVSGHPSLKSLLIDGFVRRNNSLLLPLPQGNALLEEQRRITKEVIESMPPSSFGGEVCICLATRAPRQFMCEISQDEENEVIGKWEDAFLRNKEEWRRLYPQAKFYDLNADHWSVFEDTSLDALYKVVQENWSINQSEE